MIRMQLNYDYFVLAQPLIMVAAALVTLVIVKNISDTALDFLLICFSDNGKCCLSVKLVYMSWEYNGQIFIDV